MKIVDADPGVRIDNPERRVLLFKVHQHPRQHGMLQHIGMVRINFQCRLEFPGCFFVPLMNSQIATEIVMRKSVAFGHS